MFKPAALLVPTYLTSPWRGHRQLSLSSLSHWKVKGKQQPRRRLAFSAQRLTLWLCLSSPPPSPPSSSKCRLSHANSLKQLSAALSSALLPLPKTRSSCGTSRPLLHTVLDKTRCSSWLPLAHANERGRVSAQSYLYGAGRHTPTLSVAQHSCE